MANHDFLVLILLGLNIVQFLFWSRDHHRLIDKVMSRNYAEYVQTQGFKKPLPMTVISPFEDEHEEQEVLSELNGMLSR